VGLPLVSEKEKLDVYEFLRIYRRLNSISIWMRSKDHFWLNGL